MKYAWIGGLCLLGAMWLAWISPPGGVAGLVGMAAREDRTESSRTKVRERDREARREAGSVAEEYLMKAKRGMTEDEVRWLVEDFVALGLDVEYPEDKTSEGYLALRKAREDWYLGALVSGLRLTKEQEREAREQMGVLREKDYAVFVEYLDGLKSFEHEGREMKVFDGGKARRFMDAKSWLTPTFTPSSLCVLSEEQRQIIQGDHHPKDPFTDVEGDNQSNEVHSFSLYLPFFFRVFPLNEEQNEKLSAAMGESESWLSQSMCLHPAQLRLHILTEPDIAKELRKEIEATVD